MKFMTSCVMMFVCIASGTVFEVSLLAEATSLAPGAASTQPAAADASVSGPTTAAASDSPAANIFHIPGLSFTGEPKVGDKGVAGFDYELVYQEAVIGRKDDIVGSNLDLEFRSKGFVSNNRSKDPGSLISEVRLSGNLVGFDTQGDLVQREARARQIEGWYREYRDASPGRQAEIEELRNRNSSRGRFADLDIHIKSEAEQSYENDQVAAGIGVQSDMAVFEGTDRIAEWMDKPFALIRDPQQERWSPQLARFYVGADYVNADSDKARAALTKDDEFARLTFQLAYETMVLKNVRLTAKWQVYWEPDAPSGIRKDGKDLNSFIELKAAIPIRDRGPEFFIKYTDGNLPATDENASEVAVGFSFGI